MTAIVFAMIAVGFLLMLGLQHVKGCGARQHVAVDAIGLDVLRRPSTSVRVNAVLAVRA